MRSSNFFTNSFILKPEESPPAGQQKYSNNFNIGLESHDNHPLMLMLNCFVIIFTLFSALPLNNFYCKFKQAQKDCIPECSGHSLYILVLVTLSFH